MKTMRPDKRKSGIPLIGELPWGSRFCQFYRTTEELLDVLVPYFKAGLENNELCLWVTSGMSGDEDANEALKKAIPDFGKYAAKGQMEIISYCHWQSGGRQPGGTVVAMLDRAVSTGFDGLRLACRAFPEKEGDPLFTTFTVHEIDDISRYNVLALFAYPRGQFNASALMEVMKNHRCALVRNADRWEVIESSEARIVRDELKRSEEKLQILFSNMTEGFAYHRIVLDGGGKPCDYVFLEVNNAFERLTGLTAANIVGKRATQVILGIEKDPTDWIGKFGEVALTGKPIQFESYAEPLKRWYSVSAFSAYKCFFAVTFSDITMRKQADEENIKLNAELKRKVAELSAANSSLRDSRLAALNLMEDAVTARKQAEETSAALRSEIAERKQVEQALMESESFYSQTLESIPGMVFTTRPDGYCDYQSRQWVEFTGIPMSEHTGDGWNKLLHPDDRGRAFAAWSAAVEGRAPYDLEYRVRRRDGEYLWFKVIGRPIRAATGQVVKWFGVAVNIDAIKRAEEALQKAHDELETKVEERTAELREKDQLLLQQSRQAAMGEMIGNIAHQWRQPLNSLSLIIGMLPMLQETGELTATQLEILEEKAAGIIQHMSQTIEDFSNYFKPDKEKVMFRAGDAVAKTLSLLKDSFGNREITIEVNAAEDPVIDGYPNEFSQVLLNILLNARDAFSERKVGEPKVVITMTVENRRAVVTVTDNAGGIQEEIIDKIFDPYFTTKGPEQGTGVGLFMSKGIIEKNMGGRLTVRNAGNGAEFRIEV